MKRLCDGERSEQTLGESLKAGLLVSLGGGAENGFTSQFQLGDFDGCASSRGAEQKALLRSQGHRGRGTAGSERLGKGDGVWVASLRGRVVRRCWREDDCSEPFPCGGAGMSLSG